MKKISTILLLLAFLLNIAGAAIFYTIQCYVVKEEMKSYLKNYALDKTEVFTIPISNITLNNTINWENEDEFEYNNDMYDILKKDTANGILTVYTVADKKESSLLTAYQQINNQHTSKEKSSSLLRFFQTIYTENSTTYYFKHAIIAIEHQSKYHSTIPTLFFTTEVPPPKFILIFKLILSI